MKKRNVILALLFGLLFLFIMILVLLKKTGTFDQSVYQAVISLRSTFFDTYFISITKLANTSAILLLVLLFVLIFRNRSAFYLVISTIDCFLLTTLFKFIVQRDRPNCLRLIHQGGYSFPSGHTMMSVCVYGFLFYLATTKIKNRILKYCVSSVLLLVILSIGISRIYVGVHFASDVLAGYALSLCYLLLLIEVSKKIELMRG